MTTDWHSLLGFLRILWGISQLEWASEPHRVTGGYGRRSWLLELASPEWSGQRNFQLRCADPWKPSLRHEVERLRWLASRDYPVSPPVLWVEDVDVIGEPFALLEWVPGQTLAEQIRSGGWRADSIEGRTIGHLLARLHILSPKGFPAEATPGTWIPPVDEIAGLLGSRRLGLLRQWLGGHRVGRRAFTVCHLDLHPLNVVMSDDGPVVIDWEMARIEDPLMDIAMSQVHTEVALGIAEYPRLGDRFAYGQSVLEAYRGFRPVPEGELGYFRILAACRRLGDVAGALARAGLSEENRAELNTEGASAITILDREIGVTDKMIASQIRWR